ncbi:MAG: hypothetical protein D6714_21000, partial [Bacteroidetes bacterium]
MHTCRFSFLFLWLFGTTLPFSAAGQQTVGIFLNTPESFNGYTLFGNNETTWLIDNCGAVVHTWQSDFDPGLGMYLLDNGDLLRTAEIAGNFNAGGRGGRFERLSPDGQIAWAFEYADNTVHAHHDIAPMPNGHFLAIAWEKHSNSESLAAGRAGGGEIWSERIVELAPFGNNGAQIVWEWRLWDHLIQDADPTKNNFGDVGAHPERVDVNFIGDGDPNDPDWIHLNAIDYHPGLDQILVSSRHFSEVWVIDHSTTTAEAAGHSGGNQGKGGDLLYRFGNPEAYRRGTANDRLLFGQHDAKWIAEGLPGASKIIVFNNQKPGGGSAVEIWSPPVQTDGSYDLAPGAPFGPAAMDWSYAAPGFSSPILSGAQVLPNGNILICEGKKGRIFEVTPEKTMVWEYINPVNRNGGPTAQGGTVHFNDLFRATRYAPDFPGLANFDLTPGPPVEINPWPLDCTIYEATPVAETPRPVAGFRIEGNPFGDQLVVFSETPQTRPVTLFSITGAVVFSGILKPGKNIFDLTGLP